MTLLWNLVQNGALWNFGFLDHGLKVPTITSRPRIDPTEKLSWIIEIWKVYLSSTRCDEKNPEIISKMEEIKFLAKFAEEMKFHENRGKFELKLNIGSVIN